MIRPAPDRRPAVLEQQTLSVVWLLLAYMLVAGMLITGLLMGAPA